MGLLQRALTLKMQFAVTDGKYNLGRKLLLSDLKYNHPYNSYLIKGLPPGPISNPSFNSLMAAGQPSSHDFFYFVAKGECSHVFSTNYEDHLRAVQKYQLRK